MGAEQARNRADYRGEESPNAWLAAAQHEVKLVVIEKFHTVCVRRHECTLTSLLHEVLAEQEEIPFGLADQQYPCRPRVPSASIPDEELAYTKRGFEVPL